MLFFGSDIEREKKKKKKKKKKKRYKYHSEFVKTRKNGVIRQSKFSSFPHAFSNKFENF